MDRLVETEALRTLGWGVGERGGGEETERAGDDGRLVGETVEMASALLQRKKGREENNAGSHVAKEVLGEDDTVELPRVRDHDHRRRVDELVLELEVREFAGHELRNRLAPESRGGEDVGLVDREDREGRVLRLGDLAGDARDALDFRDGVDHVVPSDAFVVNLLALAEVDATDELGGGRRVVSDPTR